MYIIELTVNTMIRTRVGRPDTHALVLAKETRDWIVIKVPARKQYTARGNYSSVWPEKSRRADGVVS